MENLFHAARRYLVITGIPALLFVIPFPISTVEVPRYIVGLLTSLVGGACGKVLLLRNLCQYVYIMSVAEQAENEAGLAVQKAALPKINIGKPGYRP